MGNSPHGEKANFDEFRRRLRELGYIEKQKVIIEERYWQGKVERLPEITMEIVQLNCDVIVTAGTEAGNAARHATTIVPIVLAFGGSRSRQRCWRGRIE